MQISIIIPVYNSELYIERAINSVSHIKKIDYEILCVNDGSTDNSLDILKNLKKRIPQLSVFTQENQGLSGARNTGIRIAKGKYILFLDADDWLSISDEYLFKILEFIKIHNVEVFGFRLKFIDSKTGEVSFMDKHPITYETVNTGIEFLKQGYQPSSSCLFLIDKSLIIKNELFFYPKISQQDVEFTLRLMLFTKSAYFSEKILYNYFRNEGSISKPKTIEAFKKNLCDAIIVAEQMKSNKLIDFEESAVHAIVKNYNSVVWNLLWRFYNDSNNFDKNFKMECIIKLRSKNLYPIKGPLKTSFQNLMRLLFNNKYFLNYFILKK